MTKEVSREVVMEFYEGSQLVEVTMMVTSIFVSNISIAFCTFLGDKALTIIL